MTRPGYAHVPSRRAPKAVVEVGAAAPAEFFARWLVSTLQHGLPARRRFGTARATVARALAPQALPSAAFRLLRASPRADLDEIRDRVERAWPDLAGRSRRLPPDPGYLTLLALARSAGLTVFVFGGPSAPLLVVKIPGDEARLQNEANALDLASAAGVAPRNLGLLDGLFVQEGMPGDPLGLAPLDADRAAELEWSPAHAAVAAGFVRLAAATAAPVRPTELSDAVERALGCDLLSRRALAILEAAWADVHDVAVSVLRHRDASPQNCLLAEGELQGFVDWENAVRHGAPGFDLWNFGLAIVEHGVGLRSWSEDAVVEAFRGAWIRSPFGHAVRSAARAAAEAAGVPRARVDALEQVFFARRLGQRLKAPAAWAVGPVGVARMVEIACAS